ncbi:hypothetical protein ACYRFS_12275 [Listeria kieliensis]
MAIKIEQSAGIPVTINKMDFEFDISDENIKRLVNIDEIIEAKIAKTDFKNTVGEGIEELTGEVFEEGLKNSAIVVKVGFDEILGEGSFEKIYKSCPSVFRVSEILLAVTEGIFQELEEMGKRIEQSQSEKAQSYLKAKKVKAKK